MFISVECFYSMLILKLKMGQIMFSVSVAILNASGEITLQPATTKTKMAGKFGCSEELNTFSGQPCPLSAPLNVSFSHACAFSCWLQ